MQKVYVGFSRPTKWMPFAWLIMTAYGIPYDHVYVKYTSVELSDTMILQASSTMVNLMSEDVFLSNHTSYKEFEISLTDAQYGALLQFAAKQLGKPYGILECVGLAWVRIVQLLGKRINNPFRFTGSTFVCSELAGYLCDNYAGMNIDVDPANINPKEMYDYLSSKFTQ